MTPSYKKRTLEWCEDCQMHDWSPGHVHKPEYRVWEDDEDEAVAVRACSFEEAATRYAELDCESDPENTYGYVEHGPTQVVVCNAEGLRKVCARSSRSVVSTK